MSICKQVELQQLIVIQGKQAVVSRTCNWHSQQCYKLPRHDDQQLGCLKASTLQHHRVATQQAFQHTQQCACALQFTTTTGKFAYLACTCPMAGQHNHVVVHHTAPPQPDAFPWQQVRFENSKATVATGNNSGTVVAQRGGPRHAC